MSVKRYYALRNLDKLCQSIGQLDHHCDGLVFTPLMERIRTGRQFSLLKWKWPGQHTIDARVQWEPSEQGDRFRLQLIEGRQYLDWCVLEEPWSQECRALGLGAANATGTIVECRHTAADMGWHVERIRRDKAVPNTWLTAEQTLQNIEENLGLDELYLVAERCMAKYNARQNQPRPRSTSLSHSFPLPEPEPTFRDEPTAKEEPTVKEEPTAEEEPTTEEKPKVYQAPNFMHPARARALGPVVETPDIMTSLTSLLQSGVLDTLTKASQ